jgi:hypothetical protein
MRAGLASGPIVPHLGAAGLDAGAAISLQLEDAVGDGRDNVVKLFKT